MKLAFLLGLLVTSAALSFGQVETSKSTDKALQEKEQLEKIAVKEKKMRQQRVKILVNDNGKEIKIDTTFNLLDQKILQDKIDSMLNKLDKSGKTKVVVLMGGDKKNMQVTGDNHIELFYDSNDSGKVKHGRRIIRFDREGNDVVTENFVGADFPPVPPIPPMGPGRMKVMRLGGDPYAHDPNNADIVSYEKKDIGKGLEKITIVRKKHETPAVPKDVEVKVDVNEEKK